VRLDDSARATALTATNSTTVRFVDTNVLLYAISRDPEEQDEAARANDILAARDVAPSVQVLQEFYVQATRASRPDPLTHEQATGLVESFLTARTTPECWSRTPSAFPDRRHRSSSGRRTMARPASTN
jgi:predicted nucleic acid-binding protein